MKRLFKKLILRIFIALIALGLLAIPALYLIALNSPTVSAAWFNDNWAHRKAITITVTSSASDVTNSQTIISVNTSTLGSKLQSACQDLRFTNTNGKLLPYYIASSCNNSSTTGVTIWVLADLVPKNTTTYTMYMYYGNPSAAAGSDSSKFSLYTGLVGYWPMDEASANSCTGGVNDNCDSSGNGNDGAWNGDATSAAGKYGNGTTFDGTGDYVSTNLTLPTSAGSVSLWAKASSTTADMRIIGAEDSSVGNHGISIRTISGNLHVVARSNGLNGDITSTVTGALSTTAFENVVVTWGSDGIKFYRNGLSAGSSTGITSISTGGLTLNIGGPGSGSSSKFNGQIDDVRIYNRAFSATEVSQLYNTSQPTTSFATEEKAPSPTAYWKFDDGQGTTAQDSTTNNYDGTITGSTWQAEDLCISGKCLYFDGTNDVVTVANTVSNIQTVSFWVRPQTTSEQFIDLNGSAYIQSSSGTISATGFTSPTIYVNGKVSSTIAANQWQYVTVTTGSALTGSAIKVGQISTNYGQGFIDEVKIYPYARSAAQILADYNSRGNNEGVSSLESSSPSTGSGRPTLSDGLVGYWKMDEASANSCTGGVNDNCDSSGNGNDGAWNGDATSAAGKYGNGVSLDGTAGTSVIVADSASIDPTNAWTLSAWVKRSATGVQHSIIEKYDWVGSKGNYFMRITSGNILQAGSIDGFSFSTCDGTSTIAAGSWYHVTATFDSSTNTLICYVNGIPENTNSSATTNPPDSDTTLKIGERGNTTGTAFNGSMDEARIYNRALSPAEVSALYNFAPGPKVYLKMDEGSGTGANDSSGNSNNGTVNSGTWTTGKYGKGVNVNGTSGSNVSVSDFGY